MIEYFEMAFHGRDDATEFEKATAEIFKVEKSSVHGSAISVSNMINIVERYNQYSYTHSDIKRIFSLDRLVLMNDLK